MRTLSKNEQLIVWALVALVVFGGGITVVLTQTRGLRNNNPGNIRRTSDRWQGLASVQSDDAFFTFTDMRYGVRAALIIFRNYVSRYGLRTIGDLVNRWAPPSENDTQAYIASVASRVGIDAAAPINLQDGDTAYEFLRGIFRHENGIYADLIPESVIREGIALA